MNWHEVVILAADRLPGDTGVALRSILARDKQGRYLFIGDSNDDIVDEEDDGLYLSFVEAKEVLQDGDWITFAEIPAKQEYVMLVMSTTFSRVLSQGRGALPDAIYRLDNGGDLIWYLPGEAAETWFSASAETLLAYAGKCFNRGQNRKRLEETLFETRYVCLHAEDLRTWYEILAKVLEDDDRRVALEKTFMLDFPGERPPRWNWGFSYDGGGPLALAAILKATIFSSAKKGNRRVWVKL